MAELHENELDRVHIQWFASEDEDADEDETSRSNEDDDDDASKELDEIDELDVSDMEPEEIQTFVKNLVARNKQLAKKSRKRLHEIMEKKNKLREIQKKDEEDRRKSLEEKEEYKKLYEDAKPKLDLLEKDVVKTQEFFEGELERQMDLLPEKYHRLVPDIDIRDRIRWIEDFRNEIGVGAKSKKSSDDEELSGSEAAKRAKAEEDESEEDEEEQPAPKTKKKKSMNTNSPPSSAEQSGSDETRSTIEQQMANCKNAAELEDLLRKYGRRE